MIKNIFVLILTIFFIYQYLYNKKVPKKTYLNKYFYTYYAFNILEQKSVSVYCGPQIVKYIRDYTE